MTAAHSSLAGLERGGRPTRELLWLALPMIGMTVSRMLMGFIDVAMVAPLGTSALAAISPATLLMFAISCVGIGIAQSVQTFSAQADGRGEPQRCGAYAWQSFFIAIVWTAITLPATLTTGSWYGWLGHRAGHPPEVLAQEIAYLQIMMWSVFPSVICFGLENFFNGVRKPRIGLIAMLASLVTNAFGNWVLIYGKLGFPALGIGGAAIATVIGWSVRAAILTGALFLPEIRQRYHTIGSWAPDLRKLKDLVWIGGPTALQWLIDIGAWVVFLQLMLPPFGEAAMAGSNLAIQYMHLCFMPALGIGMALTSQVGFAIGAQRPDEAAWRLRVARRLILGYMGLAGLFLVLFRYRLMDIFSDDPQVIVVGAQLVVWAAIFQLSDGLCITYSFGLRGAGDTRGPAMLFAICCWGIFVAGGYAVTVLVPEWGVHGPWLMCTLYIIVLGFLLWWRFAAGAWRKIRLFDHALHTTGTSPAPPGGRDVDRPPAAVVPLAEQA